MPGCCVVPKNLPLNTESTGWLVSSQSPKFTASATELVEISTKGLTAMNTSSMRARTGGLAYGDNPASNWKDISKIHVSLAKWVTEDLLERDFIDRLAALRQVEVVVKERPAFHQDRISDQICVVSGKNEVFYVANGTAITSFVLIDRDDPAAGIEVLKTLDVARDLDKREREWGLLLQPTHDGHLALVSAHSLRIVDSGLSRTMSVLRFSDELFTRNVAVDERGGIYIVSDQFMRKVIWKRSRLTPFEADGAWSSAYDGGCKEIQSAESGRRTATAPMLMGSANDPDKLVVIADAADQTKLVAFWRDNIPVGWDKLPDATTRRVAGQISISCDHKVIPEVDRSEQCLVVLDYGAFVLSKLKPTTVDENPGCLSRGIGAERFEWDPRVHGWRSLWARNEVACKSVVPTVNGSLGIVFLNSYTNGDGYKVMGMDWQTGETVR